MLLVVGCFIEKNQEKKPTLQSHPASHCFLHHPLTNNNMSAKDAGKEQHLHPLLFWCRDMSHIPMKGSVN